MEEIRRSYLKFPATGYRNCVKLLMEYVAELVEKGHLHLTRQTDENNMTEVSFVFTAQGKEHEADYIAKFCMLRTEIQYSYAKKHGIIEMPSLYYYDITYDPNTSYMLHVNDHYILHKPTLKSFVIYDQETFKSRGLVKWLSINSVGYLVETDEDKYKYRLSTQSMKYKRAILHELQDEFEGEVEYQKLSLNQLLNKE